jgi:hypothetical protein
MLINSKLTATPMISGFGSEKNSQSINISNITIEKAKQEMLWADIRCY